MQNKKITKVLAVGLCAVVLAPNLVSAKEFKDVTKNGPYGWAYTYIDELSDKGVINGYPEGDFRPDNAVSLEETVELIKGILAPTSSEIASARVKYNAVMQETKVPDWARDAFAIAIENNVFSEATLKEAASKGFIGEASDKRVPDRNTIAVYFARALKLSATGDESYLRHDDKADIPSTTRGYLSNLVKEQIFSSTGSDGKFEGTRSIRRSEMAKITKLSYDYAKSQKNKAVETTTVSGKIILATTIGNVDTIIVQQTNNSTVQIKVNNNTKITSNNSTLKFSDIKAEQEVKVTYQKSANENVATIIEVTNSAKDLVGYITRVASDGFNAKYVVNDSKVDTTGTSQFSTTDNATFTLENNAKIYSLGTETRTSNLSIDDMVEFKTNVAGKITEAYVYPRSGRVSGEIISIPSTAANSKETIKLKLADGKTYTFYGNNIGNNPFYSSSLFSDLRVGQNITITTNYKTVTRVENTNVSGSTVTGTVSYAGYTNNYANNGYDIDLRTSTGTLKLYTDRNTVFRQNGLNINQFSPSDLLNKEVSVIRNGNYIQTIEIVDRNSNFVVQARVLNYTTSGNRTTYSVRVEYVNSGNLRVSDTFDIIMEGSNSYMYRTNDIIEITGSTGTGNNMSISNVRLLSNGYGYNNNYNNPWYATRTN